MEALRGRLRAIADRVPDGARLADIGTDHAYLPIALVQSGRCPGAVACDIREKPLAAARRNVERAGLSDKISLRLGDGLAPLSPGEWDVAVIAGMGGDVISGILARAAGQVDGLLLLQPMTSPEVLRRALCAQGFQLLDERGVDERGKLYTLLTARYDGVVRDCPPLAAFVGGLRPDRPDDRRYLEKTRRRLRDAAAELRDAPGQEPAAASTAALVRELTAYLEG